jgi:high-affinity iron transporter
LKVTFKIVTPPPAHRRLGLAVALALALAPPAAAGAARPEAEAARRASVLLAAAAEECREAFDERGRLVRPIEIAEARLLVGEAEQQAAGLGPELRAALARRLAEVTARLADDAPAPDVAGRLDAIRDWLREAAGVTDDLDPPGRPSLARGEALFREHCASCHGERGRGDGPEAARLEHRPADFTDPEFMRGETPIDFFHVISLGRRLGAMPRWEDVLSVQERWDLVSHVWALSVDPATVAEGREVYLARCAGCHGAGADGRGPEAAALGTVPDLSHPGSLAGRSDAALQAAVAHGVPGTAMPAFGGSLDEEERWKAVAFLRLLSLGGGGGDGHPDSSSGPAPDGPAGAEAALAEVSRLLAASVEAHRRGEAGAASLATDAYLRFEPVERRLAASDPSLVGRLEEGFLSLRTAIHRAAPPEEVDRLAAAVRRDLDLAGAALRPAVDAYARFVQSATIILREGFEVVLIIGALLAYVARSGRPAMRRAIYLGTLLGLLASAATAVVLSTALRLQPAAAELLEGIAMLLAAAVLFSVSYWMVSKAEAERWQRYIKGKVDRALATGSGAALALAAFLAVYREGFETILFYRALLATAPAGDVAVLGGFLAGSGLLGVLYLAFLRLGMRLPLRAFFLGSGALLSFMAIVFAGKGVHELQEAGVVGLTPVAWMPRVDLLGVYPSVETLLAQTVLVIPILYGLWVTLRASRRSPGGRPARLAGELRALRAQAEAVRAEMATLRAADRPRAAAELGARLDALVERVRELEGRAVPGDGRGEA